MATFWERAACSVDPVFSVHIVFFNFGYFPFGFEGGNTF